MTTAMRQTDGKFKSPYASVEDKKRVARNRNRLRYKVSTKTYHYIKIQLLNEDYNTLKILAGRERASIPALVKSFIFRGIEECKDDRH